MKQTKDLFRLFSSLCETCESVSGKTSSSSVPYYTAQGDAIKQHYQMIFFIQDESFSKCFAH